MIGGYHAAKLQRYQDIIDHYLSKNHEGVLNMLNTRYLIVPDKDNQPMVRRNLQAFGNAWFVEGIRVEQTAEEEIDALEYLDPSADAIVHKDFEHLVKGFDPVKGGSIRLTEYTPDKMTYQAEAIGDQLAVFSEVWYGPGKGWHAYIDGQPVELLRANYILRALNVPDGTHEIVLKFHPGTYYTLKTVSLIASLLILLLIAGYIIYTQRNRVPTAEVAEDDTLIGTVQKKTVKSGGVKKRKK
jgi:hypothetical protein